MSEGVQFSPRRAETGLAVVGGLALLGLAPTLDAVGLLFLGAAGIFLLGLALLDTLLRPRLRADADGLTARTMSRQVGGPWAVVTVRVRPTRRFGVTARTLELDIGEALVVLGRRELGADPADVGPALEALRGRH